MSILELKNISLIYPNSKTNAVSDLSLKLEDKEIHALVGESGSGKTSTIRMIAGLEQASKGEIFYEGQLLSRPGFSVASEHRGISMVFQDYALFPHLSVKENISFGLKGKMKEISDKIDYFLELTGLEGLGNRYPHEISGGQMQRVALARALAPEPDLILMDEPFNNLDIRIKRKMLEEVGSILNKVGTTCLFITHEKDEAFILAHRISVMREGKILQTAKPLELYKNPIDTYVAEFFGRANHIPFLEVESGYNTPLGIISKENHFNIPDYVKQGFLVHRPWDILIEKEGDFEIEIIESYFFGDYQEVRFKPIKAKDQSVFKFFTHINQEFSKGDILKVSIPLERLSYCKD